MCSICVAHVYVAFLGINSLQYSFLFLLKSIHTLLSRLFPSLPSFHFLLSLCLVFPSHQVKTGPFAEHSNTLWGISGVAEWTKVNSGLIKMYKAKVGSSVTMATHQLHLWHVAMRIDTSCALASRLIAHSLSNEYSVREGALVSRDQ